MRILPFASILVLVSGCVVQTSGPSCGDGIRNGNESDVDCGGSCAACVVGDYCNSPADCATGICTAGRCAQGATATCNDGILNEGEVDVDCGGPCPACAPTHTTGAGGDVPVNATVYRILPGGSAVIQPGQQAGYAITANQGGAYRLVWTGDAAASSSYHEFWGSVYTTGHFTQVVPGCAQNYCPLEQGDYVGQPVSVASGEAVDFDSFATVGIDGFDFYIDTEPVYFDLYIDGQQYAQLVFFYSTDNNSISNVGVIPFGLTTQ